MTPVEVPVTLTSLGSPPRGATATIVVQSPGQRAARVLTGLGMCWGAALVGLFIPVAHFILVPTFGVAGIVVAIMRSREHRRLLGVKGACPRCGAEQTFHIGGRFEGERVLDCPRCHNNLRMAATPSPA